MNVGDKILILMNGPHGVGLVEAEVHYVYESSGMCTEMPAGHAIGLRDDQEGTVWTSGHDRTTPEAAALLVAAALSK